MKIIKNSFPSPTEKERIKTLDKYDKLYNNFQQEVLLLHELVRKQYRNAEDIVYLGHAIPAKVSDFYGDFVQGDSDRMTLDYLDDDQNIETFKQIVNDNEIVENIHDWATDQSIFGFEVLLGYVENNKFYIQDVRADQYFPQSENNVIFATYFKDTLNTLNLVDETESSLLLYTQNYVLNNGKVTITRKIWSTDIDGIAVNDLGKEILKKYFNAEAVEVLEMDELPIIQIDNGKKTKWGFGKSDYCDIMPQLAEINERRTHIATQLLKNLDAKIELPEREDMKGEGNSLKHFEYIMRTDKNEPETRYITNENPLIEATEKHITSQLQMISYITDVPMWQITESSTQPETVGGMRIKMFSALRKTNRKRMKIKKGIESIIRIGFKMLNKEMKGVIELDFSSVLPNDELEEAQVEEIKTRAGISSRRSAIKRLENYSEEDLDWEMQEIKNEDIQSGAVNPNNAPVL